MNEITSALGLRRDQVEALLTTAGRAPSLHNTQPWRFTVTPAAIEVHADRSRALAVIDPNGRELRMACGAALFNLRLALLHHDIRPLVTILPDERRPDLLAVVCHGGRKAMTTELRRLHAVVPRRHTNRSPFASVTPGPAEVNALHRAAQAEGAWLHVIADGAQRSALWEKAVRARHQQSADAGFRAELDRWTTTGSVRADGVPEAVGGPLAPLHPRSNGLIADDVAAGEGASHHELDGEPLVALLVGQETGERGEIQVGQALQRVLLTATVAGLGVSFVSHVVQVQSTRYELQGFIGGIRPPQAALQIGRGVAPIATPRRSATDLVRPRGNSAPHTAPSYRQ